MALTIGYGDHSVGCLAASGSNLFVGNTSGVFLSTDYGSTWAAETTGLHNTQILSLALSGANLVAGCANDGLPVIYRSTNNGTSWTASDSGISGAANIYPLSASGQEILGSGSEGPVIYSSNSGTSWNDVSNGVLGVSTCFGFMGTNLFASGTSGVCLSTDSGATWNIARLGAEANALAVSGTNLFAAVGGDSGVYLSTNNGKSWRVVNTGLTNLYVTGLIVVGTNLFAAAGNGSGDSVGAGIWERPLSEMLPQVLQAPVNAHWNLVSIPVQASNYQKDTLYPTAVTPAYAYSGAYVPEDTLTNGVGYWLKFDSAQTVSITGFSTAPETVQVTAGWNIIGSIYTAIADSSIGSEQGDMTISKPYGYGTNGYFLSDSIQPGKGYWVKTNESGQLILSAPSGKITPKNHPRIIQTAEMPPPPPKDQSVSKNTLPKQYALEQNFPNPFNPSTMINYALPKAGLVTLNVFNTLGQQVASLVNGQQSAGYKSVRFDMSNLPSGVYLYRLNAGSFTDVKKMILVK